MNFTEAMEKVFEGHKIRRSSWLPNVFLKCNTCTGMDYVPPLIIFEDSNGNLEDYRDYSFVRVDFLAADWEFVEE